MCTQNPSNLVSQLNERSLSILARAILLGRHQFALILVRCNYERLQQQMWQGLQQELRNQSKAEIRLREIRLSSSAPALFDTLLAVVEAEIATQPEDAASPSSRRCGLDALMVFGLESASELERVLADTNQVREEFRKYFTCPVVLWATDEVLQKMTRFAPDFKSWASAAIKFEQAIEDSIQLWWEITARLFRELLGSGAERFVSNAELGLAPGSRDRRELECARWEVLAAQIELAAMVEAIWAFILGRDAYSEGRIPQAIEQYQRSLEFWGQEADSWEPENTHPLAPNIANPFLEQKGLLLYHLGLCYSYQAREHPSRSRECASQARLCLSASLEIFTLKERPEAIANLTVQLGQVLQQLENWQELQALARGALTQSTIYNAPEVRARAYGFLARGALARGNPEAARILALKALGLHERTPSAPPLGEALYCYLLARSQYELGQTMEAIALLERARSAIAPKTIAPRSGEVQPTTEKETLYLDLLEMLRSLYFQQHHYELAFTLKQEQQRVEQACGLRAFYGLSSPAGEEEHLPSYYPTEILAFGRQRDVEALLERVRRSEHKLTVLHGPSGAGKSSLLHAGLIPALWDEIIAAREILPAIQTAYNDWQQGLSRAISRSLALRERKLGQPQTLPDLLSPTAMLDFLQSSAEGNLLVVIIFDQFEEFFYNCPQREDRQAFYQFLRDSLSIPFVKIILCLREDCLHELLAMEREMDWGIVDNNLLDRQVRYALADLSLEAAAGVVKRLTERSHFHLEDDLIERFVFDLADSQETIRPIELQVVGSALQAEKITSLQEYRQLGSNPKTILVERWLQAAIADCGLENEEFVWQVLFALTDSQGLRLLKTQAELARAVRSEAMSSPPIASILKILVGSGLVSRVREESDERYQLVHGYLVGRIRKQYNDRTSRAIATQLSGSKAELTRARKQRFHALAIGGICALLALSAVYLSLQTETQRRLATIVSRNAELMALSASSEALFASNQQFEALLEGLRAVKQLKAKPPTRQKPSLQALHLPTDSATAVKTDTRLKVLTVLEQALYGTLERNRLEGHSDVVWGVCFSPDGQRIATASLDRTVKIWHPDGRLLTTLFGHRDSVTSVDIGRDGSIASSSWDGTVRLWKVDGTPDLAIQAHRGRVYSVRFSRDGETLASAGADGTVKIWSRQGRLLQTLLGHEGEVNWASFSPDGSEIVSVGQDGTLRLWRVGGQVIKVVRAHKGAANYAVFSPKGDVLATAGEDRAVKLWSRDGRLLRVLSGHQGSVHAISFSPDGRQLASASNDNTIALWNRQGRLLNALKGHSDRVTSVGFSPDGLTLVSSSFDKTIKLWTLQKRSRRDPRSGTRVVLQGHGDRVLDVVFSPDGGLVATTSKDKTAKLWTRQGQLLATLRGHRDSVVAVAFSPDGELVATASKDKSVKVWTRRGQLLRTLFGHGDWVLDVQWSPDGRELATASRDKTVKLWSREGKLRQTLTGHRDRVNAIAFNTDGSLLASASDDRTINLWRSHGASRSDAQQDGTFDPQPLSTLKGHSNWVLDVAFLPQRTDGSASPLLASASYDNTVKFWSDREMLYTLKGHTDSIARLSFNPTGEILATTTWSSEVQLWRLDDTLLKTLEGHSDRATSVAWSRDGNAFATASEDKTAIIWNFDEDRLAKNACDWLRNYIHNSNEVRKSDRELCAS